jgi:hypothetical protein
MLQLGGWEIDKEIARLKVTATWHVISKVINPQMINTSCFFILISI